MERLTSPSTEDQPSLFGYAPARQYPDRPGHRGVDTSVEAAESLMPILGHLQHVVLDTITIAGKYGCTANELAERLRRPREAVQPRTTELRKKGLIADSGRRRFNANGKRAIVWTLPQYREPRDG